MIVFALTVMYMFIQVVFMRTHILCMYIACMCISRFRTRPRGSVRPGRNPLGTPERDRAGCARGCRCLHLDGCRIGRRAHYARLGSLFLVQDTALEKWFVVFDVT